MLPDTQLIIIIFGFIGQPREMIDMPLPLYPFNQNRSRARACHPRLSLARTEKQHEGEKLNFTIIMGGGLRWFAIPQQCR